MMKKEKANAHAKIKYYKLNEYIYYIEYLKFHFHISLSKVN